MSLSTLSGLVDPEILNSSGEVDFFKLKFRDYISLKDKLDSYCILNYAQLRMLMLENRQRNAIKVR